MKKLKLSKKTETLRSGDNNQPLRLQRSRRIEGLSPKQRKKFLEELQKRLEPTAVIVVIGTAGVGKTSTINAIFGVDWAVGVGKRGTTSMQEKVFEIDSVRRMKIIDLPGMGDSIERDKETAEIYKKILVYLQKK